MPSSNGTADGADDAVTLMEKAIDAVFVLKRKVREADERARQHQEETRVSFISAATVLMNEKVCATHVTTNRCQALGYLKQVTRCIRCSNCD